MQKNLYVNIDIKWIKNISFINRDICEAIVLKSKEDIIKKTIKFFSKMEINPLTILEYFNPSKGINYSSLSKKEIRKREKGIIKE